jgi:hypothetical protein
MSIAAQASRMPCAGRTRAMARKGGHSKGSVNGIVLSRRDRSAPLQRQDDLLDFLEPGGRLFAP